MYSRAALELEFEAELAEQPAAGGPGYGYGYGRGDGERCEGPQLTFPPPPAAAPPRDAWEAEAWVPVLSRRGAPHAARLAAVDLDAELTRLVLSLMVTPAAPVGDEDEDDTPSFSPEDCDAPGRGGGQEQRAPQRKAAAQGRSGRRHPAQGPQEARRHRRA